MAQGIVHGKFVHGFVSVGELLIVAEDLKKRTSNTNAGDFSIFQYNDLHSVSRALASARLSRQSVLWRLHYVYLRPTRCYQSRRNSAVEYEMSGWASSNLIRKQKTKIKLSQFHDAAERSIHISDFTRRPQTSPIRAQLPDFECGLHLHQRQPRHVLCTLLQPNCSSLA
ncbi:hypothetical protein BaRGS_00028293 [Batillaria attramentaria]|uniref:Uncharacterized protein n=1 Tax=Batillaria attramentaria TaxID=370345 RepID=A0ABD0K0D6_9CAEN